MGKNKEYLFVDGYNVINSWGRLKELSKSDLEVARLELIDIMAEYKSFSGLEIIVVFDAHQVKRNIGKVYTDKGVRVVYTRENETADHYIEKSLDKIGREERVTVATSDWLEQQIILGRGGTRISSRELEIMVNRSLKQIKHRRKKENSKNDLLIGRLDEETLKKLLNWNIGHKLDEDR